LFPLGPPGFFLFSSFPLVLFNQYSFSSYHGSLAECYQPSSASGYNLYHIASLKIQLELLAFTHSSLMLFNSVAVRSRAVERETFSMFLITFPPLKLCEVWDFSFWVQNNWVMFLGVVSAERRPYIIKECKTLEIQ